MKNINNTNKILIAIGVGVGIALLYRVFYKKNTKKVGDADPKNDGNTGNTGVAKSLDLRMKEFMDDLIKNPPNTFAEFEERGKKFNVTQEDSLKWSDANKDNPSAIKVKEILTTILKKDGLSIPSPANPKGNDFTNDLTKMVEKELSRNEKEVYILDKIKANEKENFSGFEGVKFVWNPNIEKMYPVGTIQEGEEPNYMNLDFSSFDSHELFDLFDGDSDLPDSREDYGFDGESEDFDLFDGESEDFDLFDGESEDYDLFDGESEDFDLFEGEIKDDVMKTVNTAEKSLTDLTDTEIDLMFSVVKTISENPNVKSESQALDKLQITNPKTVALFEDKLKKRLNDIKIMKKDLNWERKWARRKLVRLKRKNRKTKTNKLVATRCLKVCKSRRYKTSAGLKKCVEKCRKVTNVKLAKKIKQKIAVAPLRIKNAINNRRQKSFARQITNRKGGGIYGGKRWDNVSNDTMEKRVDEGLV